MALFVNQNSNRTKLQEKLAAELQEKAKKRADMEDLNRPDGVDDSAYLKDTKQSSRFMWLWAIIIIGVIAGIIYIVIRSS